MLVLRSCVGVCVGVWHWCVCVCVCVHVSQCIHCECVCVCVFTFTVSPCVQGLGNFGAQDIRHMAHWDTVCDPTSEDGLWGVWEVHTNDTTGAGAAELAKGGSGVFRLAPVL